MPTFSTIIQYAVHTCTILTHVHCICTYLDLVGTPANTELLDYLSIGKTWYNIFVTGVLGNIRKNNQATQFLNILTIDLTNFAELMSNYKLLFGDATSSNFKICILWDHQIWYHSILLLLCEFSDIYICLPLHWTEYLIPSRVIRYGGFDVTDLYSWCPILRWRHNCNRLVSRGRYIKSNWRPANYIMISTRLNIFLWKSLFIYIMYFMVKHHKWTIQTHKEVLLELPEGSFTRISWQKSFIFCWKVVSMAIYVSVRCKQFKIPEVVISSFYIWYKQLISMSTFGCTLWIPINKPDFLGSHSLRNVSGKKIVCKIIL